MRISAETLAESGEESNQHAVVLQHGEATGHRHAFYGGALLFRDDALARDVPARLYVGHVRIAPSGALLEHGSRPGDTGDHDPIHIPGGTYMVLRQREYVPPDTSLSTTSRFVGD
jgi:hypothetical protein